MDRTQLAAVFLGASSIALLPWASTIAQQAPTPGVPGRTILFVCEHGSAKSVIAAAHLNDLASQKGLPYRAIARGIHPDKEIPFPVKSGLAAEGLAIPGWQPKRFSEEDTLKAERVITLGCALPASKRLTVRKLQDWNEVPSPSEDYQSASQAIAIRVASLLREMTGKQAFQ